MNDLFLACFLAVVLASNEYGYALVVPGDASWLAPETIARLIEAMG